MTVTVKVISVDRASSMVKIVAIDDKTNKPVVRSPCKCSSMTAKGIESSIRKQFKIFEQPVWGGMSIYFEVE